jgi:hypothetical protein
MSQVGIEETKEALVSLIELGLEVAALAKDGLAFTDAIALGSKLVSDEKFRDKLVKGVKGSDKVLGELKDIDASEAVELLGAVYATLQKKAV